MNDRNKDRIECAIRHIQSSLDVDTWACEIAVEAMKKQLEIVRCKDCKWKQGAECVRFADVRPFPDDFCSRAERREE